MLLSPSLKKLAGEYHLSVQNGAAYGMCQGCFITLLDGSGYKQLSLYLGCGRATREEIESDEPTPFPPEALAVLDRVKEITQSGEYTLAADKPHLGVYGLELANGGNVLQIRFADTLPRMISGKVIQEMRSFIDQVLPALADQTRPARCALCGKDTEGRVPAFIDEWGGYVIPMHRACAESAAAMIGEIRPEALE
jgi:hypothetical protein